MKWLPSGVRVFGRVRWVRWVRWVRLEGDDMLMIVVMVVVMEARGKKGRPMGSGNLKKPRTKRGSM